MIRHIFSLVFLMVFYIGNAQVADTDVLFTVDEKPVYAKEFIRIFNKNLDLVKDESQKDVDEYLKLFVNYKLKLSEAQHLNLHEKPVYVRELANYKKQLAKNYLTDNKVTDALVQEAYKRIENEVKASHVLIKLDENASPEDTLKVYNKLLTLRDRIINEGYETVQKEVHNGRTVYAEDLGYFTGFKMVYKFENAAYNTKGGEVSMPFRTRFGYHIVKVFDKRMSRGERTVAHIMISNKKDTTKEDAETRINDIYKKLQQGEDFESLAKQFSEDVSSAKVGGKLAPFSGGQLSSSEFEEAAFALENIGDISKPVQSTFGWHIIKLYDKKPIPTFEEMKPELEAKVKRDSRSQLINTSIVKDLKVRYQIPNEKPDGLAYFESLLTEDYYHGSWNLPKPFDGEKALVKIGDKQLTYADFGDYLIKNQRRTNPNTSFEKIIDDKYESFLGQQLMQYRESNLENENEDYANIVAEYRDGLLLFDLMETEIWNASKTDSVGVQKYYDSHKENYYWNKRADAIVASSANKKVIKKVAKLLEKGEAPDTIKENLNVNDKVNVIFTSEIMDQDHQALPETIDFKVGISDIYEHNNAYSVVKIEKVLPRTLKTFEEAKGSVISDYQTYKETVWLENLHKKYQVSINETVLNQVKEQIKNQ